MIALNEMDILELENELMFHFSNRDLMILALTHDSYVNEHPGSESNERLEFLGDSVLDMIISYAGYRKISGGEGELHDYWKALTSQANLARVSDKLHLAKYLRLSEGLKSESPVPESIREAVYEALVGAVFIDGGYDAVTIFVERTLL